MDPCPRLGRIIRGCRFEPRYSTTGPSDALIDKLAHQWSLSESDKDRLVESREYVHDVCVTCGRIVHGEPNKIG
jgi:hypothetical protein